MDQLEERILQINQLKNASKRLQHRVDCTRLAPAYWTRKRLPRGKMRRSNQ